VTIIIIIIIIIVKSASSIQNRKLLKFSETSLCEIMYRRRQQQG